MSLKLNVENVSDEVLLEEVKRRFEQKNSTLDELEFLTKKLYELNEKLKETDSVKGEFLSLIKNVFNNPLSSLLNLSSLMQKNEDSPKTEKIKTFIDEELLKLDFQLNNIFTAAEIEAGEIASYLSEVNVKTIFEESCAPFKYLMSEKALILEPYINVEGAILSDAKKLHCIFTNLISNACKYSYRGQSIKFYADIDDDTLVVSVINRGDIIMKEYKKEVFNRFQKADKTNHARESVEGLGLGLSVVNALVESLDGTIDYDSTPEETTFKIVMKLHDKNSFEFLQGDSSNAFMFDDFNEMKEF